VQSGSGASGELTQGWVVQSGRASGTSLGAVGKGASGGYSQCAEATMSAPPLKSPCST